MILPSYCTCFEAVKGMSCTFTPSLIPPPTSASIFFTKKQKATPPPKELTWWGQLENSVGSSVLTEGLRGGSFGLSPLQRWKQSSPSRWKGRTEEKKHQYYDLIVCHHWGYYLVKRNFFHFNGPFEIISHSSIMNSSLLFFFIKKYPSWIGKHGEHKKILLSEYKSNYYYKW